MIKQSISLFISLMLLNTTTFAKSVSEKKHWTETIAVSTKSPNLNIRNIWGDITVRTGSDNEIVINVNERRYAPNQALLEKSKEVYPFDMTSDDQGASVIVGHRDQWQRRNPCRDCEVHYQFDVTVPKNTSIDVSTVLDGEINVAGIAGVVSAKNINGAITINDLQQCMSIENINDSIDLNFSRPIDEDCQLKTINGNINVTLPAATNVVLAIKANNGKIQSEFDVEPVALEPTVDIDQRGERHIYRLNRSTGLRIGRDIGPTMNISTFNGNIRIKKNSQ